MAPVILVVEDDRAIAELVKFTLEQEGYLVEVAVDGEEALRKARQSRPAVVVLDLMLPRRDGLSVCKLLKQESQVSVLMISARNKPEDRVRGLETGADDYLSKPFSVKELAARVRALLRRGVQPAAWPGEEVRLRCGEVVLRPQCQDVTVNGRPLTLAQKEFALLAALMLEAGRLLTKEALLRRVWGHAQYAGSKSLYVHLSTLRHKLEQAGASRCRIETVKGFGYRLKEE